MWTNMEMAIRCGSSPPPYNSFFILFSVFLYQKAKLVRWDTKVNLSGISFSFSFHFRVFLKYLQNLQCPTYKNVIYVIENLRTMLIHLSQFLSFELPDYAKTDENFFWNTVLAEFIEHEKLVIYLDYWGKSAPTFSKNMGFKILTFSMTLACRQLSSQNDVIEWTSHDHWYLCSKELIKHVSHDVLATFTYIGALRPVIHLI